MALYQHLVRERAIDFTRIAAGFRWKKIDFRSKGGVTFEEAAPSLGVDLDVLGQGLARLTAGFAHAPDETASLLDLIVERSGR